MRRYYIDADVLIEVVKRHKDVVKLDKEGEGSWQYERAHDHIIEIIELLKKYAIVIDRDD